MELQSKTRKPLYSLYGLEPSELADVLGLEKAYQGKQIYSWLVKGALSFDQMTNLPQSLRKDLVKLVPSLMSSMVIDRESDTTGATKLAVRLADRSVIECVLLNDERGRCTACLSSQVGCAMGCAFCRTGNMGFIRNLAFHEIIEQFVHIRNLEPTTSHIVFMGMGEPMVNLVEVLHAIKYLHDPDGFNVSMRRITISTCGMSDGIRQLAEMKIPVRLSVSLVTADNTQRDQLMPVNRKYPLEHLKKALMDYQMVTGKRFTLEYVMIHDLNTTEQAAQKLAAFMKNLHAIVNLIPYNDVAELTWKSPTNKEIAVFCRYLDTLQIPYTRRFSRGRSIQGACGQLAFPQNIIA